MPFAAIASLAGVAGNLISGANTAGAIKKATEAQQAATKQAIGTIQNNQTSSQAGFQPYLNSGTAALGGLDALLGLGGQSAASPDYAAYVQNSPDLMAAYQQNGQGQSMAQWGANHWQTNGQYEGRDVTPFSGQTQGNGQGASAQQQAAIAALKASPLYQSLFHNGQEATLANAAATGGLRGGNAERSLYNLGNDTLAQVIQNQIANLGGVAGAGQNAAGSIAGINNGASANIAGLLQQGGAQAAGGILGVNNANNSMISSLTNGLGSLAGNPQVMAALGLGGGIKGGSGGSQFGGPISLGTGGMTMPGTGFNPASFASMMAF